MKVKTRPLAISVEMFGRRFIPIVICLTAACWSLILAARLAAYDTNYVFYGIALLLATLLSGLVISGLFDQRLRSKYFLLLLIILGTTSPVSLHLFIVMYVQFIGHFFQT